jgi:MFS family permease
VPAAVIGVALAVGQLLAVPGALLMPVLAGRYGVFRTVVTALLALIGFQAALALLPYTPTAILAFVGTYVSFGMTSPAFLLYCQESVARQWRSVVSGFTSMAWSLGTAGLLFGGGYIVAFFGATGWLFLAGAATGLVGLLVFYAYFRMPRGEQVITTERVPL